MSLLENTDKTIAWVDCPLCDEFWCQIHDEHVYDCDCPAADEWGNIDPYSPGSIGGP